MTLTELIKALQHLADTCENGGETCDVEFAMFDGTYMSMDNAKLKGDIEVNMTRGALEECPAWDETVTITFTWL